jgi:two-component system, response regulator PdtaR
MNTKTPVILIAEDEAFISLYLQTILSEAGYDVIAVGDADKAIAVLEARDDVRIIMTDINMPGALNGLELAAAVKDRWPPIEIIVTTGLNPPDRDQMPVGSVFIPKPYNSEIVTSTVARLL